MRLKDWRDDFWFEWHRRGKFQEREQIVFVRQLERYQRKGNMSAKEALSTMEARYAVHLKRGHVILQLIQRLQRGMVDGSYQEMVAKYFTPVLALAFESAQLVKDEELDVVKRSLYLLKTEEQLKADTKRELMMPMVGVLLAVTVWTVIGRSILPSLDVDLSQLSGEVHVALFLGKTVGEYPLATICILFGLFKGRTAYLENHSPSDLLGGIRKMVDNTWPFSNYRSIWAIRLMVIYSILQRSEQPNDEIFMLMGKYSPRYIKKYLNEMTGAFQEGEARSDYFGKGLFSKGQQISLMDFYDLPDEEFVIGLEMVAEDAVEDISMDNAQTIIMTKQILSIMGFVLFGFAVGSIIEALTNINMGGMSG